MNFLRCLGSCARPLALISVLLLPVAAHAQTEVPALQELLAPADQKSLDDARTLARYEALWSKPLNWNAKAVSLQTLATSVQTLLGKDGPSIEVRAPDEGRVTFALRPAPLGPTLVSLARLANCRVWVFASGLVIAPESALSEEERVAIKGREGGEWTKSSVVWFSSESWGGRNHLSSVALRIVSADLLKRLAEKGQTAPAQPVTDTEERAPFELPFGELQPATQRVLQEMVDERVKDSRKPLGENETPVLLPSVIVCFDDENSGQNTLFLRGAALNRFFTRWYAPKLK